VPESKGGSPEYNAHQRHNQGNQKHGEQQGKGGGESSEQSYHYQNQPDVVGLPHWPYRQEYSLLLLMRPRPAS
jgi:hypothetical protein